MQKISGKALLKDFFFHFIVMPHLFTSYFVNSELATKVISSECLFHFILGYCMYIFLYLLKNCS